VGESARPGRERATAGEQERGEAVRDRRVLVLEALHDAERREHDEGGDRQGDRPPRSAPQLRRQRDQDESDRDREHVRDPGGRPNAAQPQANRPLTPGRRCAYSIRKRALLTPA
jgi:hypothetical protein